MSDAPRMKSNRKPKTKYENYQDAKPNGTYKSHTPPHSSHPPHKSQPLNDQVNQQTHPSKSPHPPHTQPQSAHSQSHSPHTQPQSYSQSQSSPHPQSHSHSQSHSQSQSQSQSHSQPNGFSRRGSRHDRTHGSHPSGAHHNSPHPSNAHHNSPHPNSSHQHRREHQDQPPQPQNVDLSSSQSLSYPAELTPAQIESHLLQMWNAAFDRSRNMKISEHERPVIYRDAVRAWGNDTKNPVLGDFNFYTELKKSYTTKFGSGQITKEEENGKVETTTNNASNNTVHNNSFGKSVNNGVHTNNNINNIHSTTDTNNTSNINNTQNTNINNAHNNSSNNFNNTKNKNKKNQREPEGRVNGQINKTEHYTSKQPNNTQDTKQKPKQQEKQQEKHERQGKEKQDKPEKQQEKQDKQPEKPEKQGKQQEKQEQKEKELETKQEIPEPETQQDKEDKTEQNEEAESEQYNYDFTNDEYEEISDLADSKGNPGDVIIDIPDVDDEDDMPQPTKIAQNGKSHSKPKAKKGKKGKGKPAKHHDTEKEKAESKNSSISNNNENNNNYNNSILSLASNGTNEAWNDILGNLLPRPKTEIIKASGSNTLHLNNSGNFTLAQVQTQTQNAQTLGAQNALLAGIPREVVRVFAHRFGKPNTNATTSTEYPGMLPVKWSSGDGLMSAGRKFPMEVPFLSLKDMFGSSKPSSKLSCANLKCQNTTTDDKPFKTCAKCNMTAYCSRECQVEDWAKRHKQTCKPNAAEDQRKTFATQKFWATASVRHMIFLHWYARYGKGVIVVMCKDFLSFGEDDPSGRELYIFYMPMADLMSDDCPIPALKKCQAEFAKSFVNHESDSQSIASAAVDSTGFVTPLIDEVKVLQLKLHKRSCKDHDLQKVDAIAVDAHNQATLYTFH